MCLIVKFPSSLLLLAPRNGLATCAGLNNQTLVLPLLLQSMVETCEPENMRAEVSLEAGECSFLTTPS